VPPPPDEHGATAQVEAEAESAAASARGETGSPPEAGREGASGNSAAPVDTASPPEGYDFRSIVSRYETPLLRYLRQMTSPGEAEDLAQEAFLRLHREVVRSGPGGVRKIGGFLFKVAHNLALDDRRRRRARVSLKERAARDIPPPEEDSPEGLAAVIRRAACEKALEELKALPAKQRRVLLLKVVQDFKVREIAEITGMSVGNAAYHLNAALRELARRLKTAGVI
jgi:RNA polymerase sigma-70 factor (ECF subfamily)